MSSNNITSNTGRQFFIDTDLSKIFLWQNRNIKAPYNNSGYGATTLYAGTVMGRVAASGYVIPCRSGHNDGSQIPMGILMEDIVVEAGDILDLAICNFGDVASEKLIFDQVGDTLDTVVGSQRMRDLIHQAGPRIVEGNEMTAYDNS